MKSGFEPLDFISAVGYDSFGREQFSYLSFAATSIPQSNSVLNDGSFKKNPFQQQAAFSTNQYLGETYFYGQTLYENSPLNRVEKTMSPGNSWVGSSRGVITKSWFNTGGDSVRIWSVTNATSLGFGTYSSVAIYPAGQLYKNITEDDNGKQAIEFKDKDGKVVLKKAQLSAPADNGTGRNHTGWLCTYYIYDKLGQLRCVIQPKGVELINPITTTGSNWTLSNSILDEQCFRYEYDSQGRMIIKKVPGAGSVIMVYDKRDRLIMTQDSNMRKAGQWMITQFDNLNRQVKNGIWINSSSFSFHQNLSKDTIGYPFIAIPSTGCELLNETHYDDYIGLTSTLNPNLDNTVWGGSFLTTYNSSPEYAQELKKSSATIGLPTWSKVKVLGTNQYLSSVSIYDDKGRVIQTKTENITGGIDIFSTQYDFSGKVLRSHLKHEANLPSPQSYLVGTKLTYDVLGRLIKTEKALNDGAWKTISVHEYDALGQLIKKKIGTNPIVPTCPLDSIKYDYNIRGWMLGANRNFTKNKADTTTFFGFDLGYDKTSLGSIGSYNSSQYNGNITGTVWKTRGDNEIRKYDFTYDAVNRITGGNFNQYTGTTFNKTANIDFSVSNLTYDANGNILTMNQKGLKLNSSSPIDALKYYYFPNSNKLKAVVDTSNDPISKLGDFKYEGNKTASATDYSYDVNGNLLSDANKAITSIQYNHLNLPQLIKISGKGTITYLYDAAGNKLKKFVIDSTISSVKKDTTLYMAGIYQNSVLQFLPQEEGRIRFKPAEETIPASFQWDYMLKDHLGNVRMVLTEEKRVDIGPSATFENATTANEQIYYEKVNLSRVTRSGNSTDLEQLLRKSTNSIGVGKLLKVMATDKLHIKVDCFVQSGTTDNSSANGLNSFLTDLIGILSNAPTPIKGNGAILGSALNVPGSAFTNLLNQQSSSVPSSLPKAYLNILFFDEQFKFVEQGSEVITVGSFGSSQIIRAVSNPKVASKNGYAYVYVSNESNNFVYFDNFQVSHERGPILEETHYYPFGLTLTGISSQSAGGVVNKNKFNAGSELQNKEFSDDSGLEIYYTLFRQLNPQLGRWWQLDPKPNYTESLYAIMGNDPILKNDPLGDTLIFEGSKPFRSQLNQAIGYLGKNKKGQFIRELAHSKYKYTIRESTEANDYFTYSGANGGEGGGTIFWNPHLALENDGVVISPTTALNHELDHAASNSRDPKAYHKRNRTEDMQYGSKEEKRVITGSEQETAKALGEVKKGKVTRTNHEGNPVFVNNPTAIKTGTF